MSNSLLKKGLTLFDDDLEGIKIKKKKKSINKEEEEEVIGYTNRQGIRKHEQKEKRKQELDRQFKVKKKKTIEDEYSKYRCTNNTDVNLYLISKLSALDSTTPLITSKVLDQHAKLKRHNREGVSSSQPTVQESVFSEKDFDNFAKEYETDKWDKD